MNSLFLVAATFGDKIDDAFRGFDMWVYHIFGAMQNGFLTWVAKFFTSFGDENFVIPIAVLGVVLCLFKKTRKFGFALVFSIAIGTIVTNVVVKPMVLRIRPYNTLQKFPELWAQYEGWYKAAGTLSESDYSFPSGHTTAAFEMGISMLLCFKSRAKELKAQGVKTSMGKIAWIFPIASICVMGSRVYLMVHYPTDVIGGMLVGACAGVLGFFISKLFCSIFEKVKFLDSIDLEKIKKDGFNKKAVSIILCVVVCAAFAYSFVPAINEGEAKKCEYSEEYDCQNAARVDDEKYPAFDSDGDGDDDYYCKIHWKQLKGVE